MDSMTKPGFKHSAETRAKMSAAGKGKPKSAETRARMSEARKRIYADPAEREKQRERGKTFPGYHGMVGTPTYVSWYAMKQRCLNPNNKSFKGYGERGITICHQWRDSFPTFLADMGERPPGYSLDRVDNSKGYEPDNCRWATPHEQRMNQDRMKDRRPDSTSETV